jgi:Family of unknown function (DUF6010)
MIGYFLLGGAINAIVLSVIAFLLSRFVKDIYGRYLLVIFLFIAGGAYVGFAVEAGASVPWFYAEIAHVIVIGTMGLLSLYGSPYWIAAGWAVHPIWDFVPHYLGSGHAFAPESWAISCISWDWLVAAYIVIAYGLVGARRLGFREVATTT